MKRVLAAILLLGPAFAWADLVSDFRQMERLHKGPFSLNSLQGTQSRIVVTQGRPAGRLLFQAAFRNEHARSMAAQHDFYIGNLFTTNYYELIGEYVFGTIDGSYELEHDHLLRVKHRALPKAASMVRHWILEKYYVATNAGTKLQRAFQLRGISDAENEREYAHYFFNFYLSAINSDLQYLPAVILIRASPISESVAINRARDLIAKLYNDFAEVLGAQNPMVLRLYRLRNAIHNQLNKSIVVEIDQFLKDFPSFENPMDLLAVRRTLADYYSVSAAKIARLAQDLGFGDIAVAAGRSLLELAQEVAQLRGELLSDRVPVQQKTRVLLLLTTATQFIAKELSESSNLTSETLEILIHTAYAEGFLIQRNHEYFLRSAMSAKTKSELQELLSKVTAAAHSTLTRSVAPALDQWVSIKPSMQNFLDNELKSSAIGALP